MDEKKKEGLERPHVVDGIKEYDNPLPAWWVWIFVLTIVFGLGYMAYYHIGNGTSLDEQLAADLAPGEQTSDSTSPASSSDSDPATSPPPARLDMAAMVKNPEVLAAGKSHYDTYCSPCHLPDLGGQIGPNLTDDFWIHGCTTEDIVRTIEEGVPDKGMAAWGPILGKKKIHEVTAYILSKRESTPAKPKESQGAPCQWTP